MTELKGPLTQGFLGGKTFLAHIKEHRPKMYKELKEAGELEQVAYQRQELAIEILADGLRRGMNPYQAREVASEVIYLPEE